jgi:hypothetical protein
MSGETTILTTSLAYVTQEFCYGVFGLCWQDMLYGVRI